MLQSGFLLCYLNSMAEDTNINNNLMLEILKDIQHNVRKLTDDNKEIKQGLLRVRDDVHGLRGDVLSLERRLVEVESRLDRVEVRLGLAESQH